MAKRSPFDAILAGGGGVPGDMPAEMPGGGGAPIPGEMPTASGGGGNEGFMKALHNAMKKSSKKKKKKGRK